MLRKIASAVFLLTGLLMGLGAFGHDSNGAKLAAEFAKFPAFDERFHAVIVATWHFCSGCMLVFGVILVWAWWRARNGAREALFAAYPIGIFYIAAGVLSVVYTGIAFFWSFLVLGLLLVVTAAVLHRQAAG